MVWPSSDHIKKSSFAFHFVLKHSSFYTVDRQTERNFTLLGNCCSRGFSFIQLPLLSDMMNVPMEQHVSLVTCACRLLFMSYLWLLSLCHMSSCYSQVLLLLHRGVHGRAWLDQSDRSFTLPVSLLAKVVLPSSGVQVSAHSHTVLSLFKDS